MTTFRAVILLLMSVIAGISIDIAGAESRSEPSPTAAPRSTETPSPHKATERYNIRLRMPQKACMRPGDTVTLSGEGFYIFDEYRLAFNVENRLVIAEILSKTDHRIVVRIPKKQLIAGRIYPLFIVQIDGIRKVQKTNLSMKICAVPGFINDQAEDPPDVLVFADLVRRQAILQELRSRAIVPQEEIALSSIDSVLVRFASSDPQQIISELRQALPWAEVDMNTGLSPASRPRLYAKEKIDWPKDEACLHNTQKIKIGLLDGAIVSSHSAMKGQKIHTKFFLTEEDADYDHATAIASIFVGNSPPDRLRGLLVGASIFSAVILKKGSANGPTSQVFRFAQGLNWLMSEHVRLINVSLASNIPNRVLTATVKKALARGASIFAAAGNQGPNSPPSYPAALDGVIAVTAIDIAGKVYSKANTGDYIDLAAPGVDIWAAKASGGGHYVSGTSFAVPFALSVAALNEIFYGPLSTAAPVEKLNAEPSGKNEETGYGANVRLVQGFCP